MVKKCVYCGKEFTPKRFTDRQVCCSSLCNSRKWQQNNPAKKKAYQKYYASQNSKKIGVVKKDVKDIVMDGIDCLGVYFKMKRMASN